MIPSHFQKTIQALRSVPGIGLRTAEKMAFALFDHHIPQGAALGQTLLHTAENLHECTHCRCLSESPVCEICASTTREQTLCIVKESYDIVHIERSHAYHGKYHVLHGLISPIEGITPQTLQLQTLCDRIIKEQCTELIYALDTSLFGEATIHAIQNELHKNGITIRETHIARGIPLGSDFGSLSDRTIKEALLQRRTR